MSKRPTKAGRKPGQTRMGTKEEWRRRLNASLERRGVRPVGMRDEIRGEFERSKYFAAKAAGAKGVLKRQDAGTQSTAGGKKP